VEILEREGNEMAFDRKTVIEHARGADAAMVDEGLRAFMLKVYNYMCLGLGVTGAVAMFTASSEGMMQAIYGTPLAWLVMLSPLAFILVLSFGLNKLSVGATQALFWAFAVVMGLSMASIFMVYTNTSIARVFFITAAAFAGLSLYGYTTKRNLSGMGSFMVMGLIGIIIAMLVNLFLQSSALHFAISVIGVLVFAGLTAWDTQKLKMVYAAQSGDAAVAEKSAIMGALRLYLDFVNMFYFLLHLFGGRE
jgi:FtsH-binding integral membrane protein